MNKEIFDNKKREWFPEIKDFSDPQDRLRFAPGHSLSFGDWFWFNPSAFRLLIIYGTGLSCFFNLCLAFFCYYTGRLVLGALCCFFCIICFVSFHKHWLLRKHYKLLSFNFYDLFLRDDVVFEESKKKL